MLDKRIRGRRLRLPLTDAERTDGLVGLPLKPNKIVKRSRSVSHELPAGFLGDRRQLRCPLDRHPTKDRLFGAEGFAECFRQFLDALAKDAAHIDFREALRSIALLRRTDAMRASNRQRIGCWLTKH